MSGWISLHRKILEWEWYDDANVCRLFIHCLLKANHQQKKWKGIEINRGQFITSLDRLSSETGLTVSQIRTCIKKLKSTNEIASKSHTQHTVITIVSYESYQGDDKRVGKRVTDESQTNDKRMTTTNNDNKENKENKHISPSRFDEFWSVYKKSADKKKCQTKFEKLTDADVDKLFEVLPDYIKSTPDPKFRKNPLTWLNGECWNDEVQTVGGNGDSEISACSQIMRGML
ncbi:hypothetical protein NVP1133O_46 [Vibrio phage 1.133.O._10N.222.51.E4]|nr:hypothetical protein NVP1133O_46 [Vibrio phage 1.133.O._10N.222.51.E4]